MDTADADATSAGLSLSETPATQNVPAATSTRKTMATHARHREDPRDDNELLLAAVKEPDALGELYRRHVDAVVKFFVRRVLDQHVALELTAETFAELVVCAKRFDPAKGNARGFLFGIANMQLRRFRRKSAVSFKYRRKLGMRRDNYVTDGIADAEDVVFLQQIRPALAAALQDLPKGERDAVEAKVMRDMSYADVAELLGCSQGAARVRVSRGLARLSEKLTDPMFDPNTTP